MKSPQILGAAVAAAVFSLAAAHSASMHHAVTDVNCSAPPDILSYHVHIVYSVTDDEQIKRASELRDAARSAFAPYLGPDCVCATDPDCRYDNGRLCLIYDHGINETLNGGPFPSGEWSIFVPVDYYGLVVPWFTQRYLTTSSAFSLLVHTNTGCEYEDHSIWALWAGSAWPLNMAIFQQGKQTNEFNETRGSLANPVCLSEGNMCGGAIAPGPQVVCCDELTCDCSAQNGCFCTAQ